MPVRQVVLLCALVVALASASTTVPMKSLYQSNGETCESFPLDSCIPCGSHYYSCSDDGDGDFSCIEATDSACSLIQTSLYPSAYCSSQACSFAQLPNYQFEISAPSGLAVFHTSESDVYGSVILNSTDLTAVSNDFRGIVVTSAAASDVLFMEQGIFSDNTILTNKGFCTVGDWCTADSDLSYRMSLLPSNDSHPVTPVHPESNTLALLFDSLGLMSTSEQLDMFWYDERMYIPDDQISALEVNIWPTGIKWTNFQLKDIYSETQIVYSVTAGSDFSIYMADECDDDDSVHSCHLDPIFDLSGIISNPFIHPFFSFSFLFEDVEEPAGEANWDELPTFNLFE